MRKTTRQDLVLIERCAAQQEASLCLWISGHEGVHVVVDQLEDEASVHQVETALRVGKEDAALSA